MKRVAATGLVIEGPITGGTPDRPFASSVIDLTPLGYREVEYFVSGEARAYAPAGHTRVEDDGRWQAVAIGDAMPYRTRVLVRAPVRGFFNGTVIVEWMQEIHGTERDINYRWNADAMVQAGFAWVGVSLHHEGVDGGAGCSLVRANPERYGTLRIPSSDLSYDILTQVGTLVGLLRTPRGIDALQGLTVRKLIAVGNSLSAWRLSTYINAVQPLTGVFDGFFLQDFRHKTVEDRQDAAFPHARWIRADSAVPVMLLNTTPAALRTVGQPVGALLRRWEPAGASHTNAFLMRRTALVEKRDNDLDLDICDQHTANSIPMQYFSSAALVALNRWVDEGLPAPDFQPIATAQENGEVVALTDLHGNVRGGIRHPWVDVPVARYASDGHCIGGSGRTHWFAAATLRALYGSPSRYRALFADAVRSAERTGTVLPVAAAAAVDDAARIEW